MVNPGIRHPGFKGNTLFPQFLLTNGTKEAKTTVEPFII